MIFFCFVLVFCFLLVNHDPRARARPAHTHTHIPGHAADDDRGCADRQLSQQNPPGVAAGHLPRASSRREPQRPNDT